MNTNINPKEWKIMYNKYMHERDSSNIDESYTV
jgi:hypothetical protein